MKQPSMFVSAGADFAECPGTPGMTGVWGKWRYLLWRYWRESDGIVTWIMLNPSIADETILDPTVKGCVQFSKAWGFGGIEVVNIFALVSTDPKALSTHHDPVGPQNDRYILESAGRAARIIVAWGVHGRYSRRGADVVKLLQGAGLTVECLGTTKEGFPKHPLYVARKTPPVPYRIDIHPGE